MVEVPWDLHIVPLSNLWSHSHHHFPSCKITLSNWAHHCHWLHHLYLLFLHYELLLSFVLLLKSLLKPTAHGQCECTIESQELLLIQLDPTVYVFRSPRKLLWTHLIGWSNSFQTCITHADSFPPVNWTAHTLPNFSLLILPSLTASPRLFQLWVSHLYMPWVLGAWAFNWLSSPANTIVQPPAGLALTTWLPVNVNVIWLLRKGMTWIQFRILKFGDALLESHIL